MKKIEKTLKEEKPRKRKSSDKRSVSNRVVRLTEKFIDQYRETLRRLA